MLELGKDCSELLKGLGRKGLKPAMPKYASLLPICGLFTSLESESVPGSKTPPISGMPAPPKHWTCQLSRAHRRGSSRLGTEAYGVEVPVAPNYFLKPG